MPEQKYTKVRYPEMVDYLEAKAFTSQTYWLAKHGCHLWELLCDICALDTEYTYAEAAELLWSACGVNIAEDGFISTKAQLDRYIRLVIRNVAKEYVVTKGKDAGLPVPVKIFKGTFTL